MSSARQKSRVDDEEDLDDLDDVLDQFSVPPAQPTPVNASASSQPTQPAVDAHPTEALPDELAAEFAKEMESLLSQLSDPSAGWKGADGAGTSEQKQMAAAWEAMLVEGMDAMSAPSMSQAGTPADASSPQHPAREADFQSRIRSTVNRLRESESGLHPSDSSVGGVGDAFESLLSQLGDLNGDGPQNEEQLQGVLEAMMGQLMSKEILYEPLKELHEKFPRYLAEHASTISPEDKTRYEAQISSIKRLIIEFEASTYRDDDDEARERIVELMGELQAHGQPPEEIMGPLPPGFSFGTGGLPEMPGDCNMN